MAEQNNIANNPFAALFPSLDDAQMYASNKRLTQDNDFHTENISLSEEPKRNEELSEEEIRLLSVYKRRVSCMLEKVFLITLDNDEAFEEGRPVRCVYMEGLAETLDGQTWLDVDCLEQAVFERLLLENPGGSVIVTSPRSVGRPTEASQAAERHVLRYLTQCYSRLGKLAQNNEYSDLDTELSRCRSVILLNSKTCLQQSELYPDQNIRKQFIDIYLEACHFLSDDTSTQEFFLRTSDEIHKNNEDGSLSEVFTPVLDALKAKFITEFTLMHPDVTRYLGLISFFTQSAPLAEMFMAYNTPTDWTRGRDFEKTLLGAMLSYSPIPEQGKPNTFFENPSTTPKQEHDIAEKNIWLPLSGTCQLVYEIIRSIIKVSPHLKHTVLSWIGKCISANSGRAKLWTAHAQQGYGQIYTSDGYSLNLCYIMLKLCEPFSKPCSKLLLKIQPSYLRAIAADDNDARERGIHSQDLSKETCLIPLGENETIAEDKNFNFITECFFLTHQAINQGFHAVHEKFLKMNQELHQIQQAYDALRAQGAGQDDVNVTRYKAFMEKGMKEYMCTKAALTEPQLLEMTLKFSIATSTWLVQVARSSDFTDFEPITFPLPDQVPVALGYTPEFIMGNVTDFTLFLHRFKDEMYESSGSGLEHLMTLILVYMGSPDRMKNPHLRAELAETLAALMPFNPDSNNVRTGMLSKYYREQVFQHHPLISHLAEKLIHVFVSIEMTGQSVQFEQKFNYRRPMYKVLHYIWEKQIHKDAIKSLAEHAEASIEDTDAPLFLRFINLLVNDAIFLLDEALDFMKQLKELQGVRDGPEWAGMTAVAQRQHTSNLQQIGKLARYHNMMGNLTILTLEMLTRDIRSIFCHSVMVDRIAAMLNYFLLHLVGPKQREIKVKDKNEFEFKPDVLVSDIAKIYLNLSNDEAFCRAVSGDGRSYSPELFPKAVRVLQKICSPPVMISNFESLHTKISAVGEALELEEELMADAPEEFLDPIMGTLMREPVKLPTSGNIVDRSIISRHILSDQNDPFNRAPLSLDMVVPMVDLKARIEAWIQEQRDKHNSDT
ncbi:ubiquitin conjugation factor E4 A-like isoform X2 [Mya arenaria]|uniref:ubiquitin conjugation factor E4 A-like isoform X2 n=1 Tax=Mya arenaria TaxID=6604 RepID=UPI0022E12C4B|nr:ubiquitin conjugation factor E4 A-like isoform X2 [Mya arenaria]